MTTPAASVLVPVVDEAAQMAELIRGAPYHALFEEVRPHLPAGEGG